jgi:predicted MFS family arabinose efflux permease
MGFMQSFGSNLLGTMLAPVVLVALATNYGWRNAFFIAGIPGLILAAIGFLIIKETTTVVKEQKQKVSIGSLLQYRNVWVAIVLSCCMMTWMFAQITFMPKFLIEIKHFSHDDMGKIMGAFGLGAIIWVQWYRRFQTGWAENRCNIFLPDEHDHAIGCRICRQCF